MKLCRPLAVVVLVPALAMGVDSGARKLEGWMNQDPSNWLGGLPSEDSIPIEAIEAEVLALARAAKSKGTREGNIQTFAKQLNNTIQNEMFGQLRNKSRKDMQKLMASRDAVAGCAEFLHGVKTVKDRTETDTQFKKYVSSHNTCRRKEMEMFQDRNQKKNDRDKKKKTKNTLCDALELKRNSPSDENDCKPEPNKKLADQNPDAVWIELKEGRFKEEVKQYEDEVAACELAKKLHNEAEEVLAEAERVLAAQKSQCDSDQGDAMTNECELRKKQRSSNTAYENCYQPALNTFEADAYQVKMNVRKRKLEWRTLERITCLIMALVSADGGQIDAQINFCIRQIYDGHQMNLIQPKIPDKKKLVSEIIAPCTAKTNNKFWAPADILSEFLLNCQKCPLPKTAKPTPAPTPPPPPPKFQCKFSAKQTLVHVRYGGFFKKLKKNSFDQWKFPLTFQEWNATSEMEVLVANSESNPSLKFECKYLDTPAFNHKKYKPQWDIKSSKAPVVAAYGTDYDKAQMAQTFWPKISSEGYVYPPTTKPGFGNFIIAPFCDVFCKAKFDDQVLSIVYNGRAITIRDPEPDNQEAIEAGTDAEPKWQQKEKLTQFCFKQEKKATLSVEVFDITAPQGGFVMVCESEMAAWSDVSTMDTQRMSISTKAAPADKYKEGNVNLLRPVYLNKKNTKIGSRTMVWVKEENKDKYVKFTFKGNKID